MHMVKMTSKGQVIRPKQIREKLRLRAGTYLEARIRGTELVLREVDCEAQVWVSLPWTVTLDTLKADGVRGRLRGRLGWL